MATDMPVNQEQRTALLKLWERNDQGMSFEAFVDTARPELMGCGCIMVPWSGMLIGIETDGHAHS